MSKRNNLYLLISLPALIVILVAMIYFRNSHDTIDVDRNLFKVADQTKIDRVTLIKAGEEIQLHFNGTKWMVNDTHEADRQLIQVFFATLLQAEPRKPVAQRQQDSIRLLLNSKGTEVKLYEGETLMKQFSVVGNERKSDTYYQIEGDQVPYQVTIPGYRVYVAAIFELTSLDWRDKRIFNFNWQNFKRLTASFKGNEKESYAISFQDNFFGLEGNIKADTSKMNDYLDAVSLVQAVRFLPMGSSHEYDSLLNTSPYYSIEATDIANRTYRLDIFEPDKRQATVLAKMGDGQPVLISREDFLRLNRKKSQFTP